MLTPGPRTTGTPRARASRPTAAPIRSAISGSQLDPTATAGGKQVAGALSSSPIWSKSPICRRTPCGPSVSTTEGRPASSTAGVDQKSWPERSTAFFSSGSAVGSDGVVGVTPRSCRRLATAVRSGAIQRQASRPGRDSGDGDVHRKRALGDDLWVAGPGHDRGEGHWWSSGLKNSAGFSTGAGTVTSRLNEWLPEPTATGALPSGSAISAVVFAGTTTSSANAEPSTVQDTDAVPYGVSWVAAAEVIPGPGRGATRSRR